MLVELVIDDRQAAGHGLVDGSHGVKPSPSVHSRAPRRSVGQADDSLEHLLVVRQSQLSGSAHAALLHMRYIAGG